MKTETIKSFKVKEGKCYLQRVEKENETYYRVLHYTGLNVLHTNRKYNTYEMANHEFTFLYCMIGAL